MTIKRASFTAAALLCLVAAGHAQERGWSANPEAVRKAAVDQPGFNYDESKVAPYTLPDVFGAGGGLRTPEEWRPRRQQLLELFREHVYGRSPGKPDSIRFERIEHDPRAMDGAATLERVAIVSGHAGREHRFQLTLMVPNARTTPAPVFLLLNNRPASNVDPTRKQRSGFWPAEEVIARGYAIAAIQVAELAPDDKDRFRDGVIALFEGKDAANRPKNAWGALAAWAWGASRVMDYFETNPRIAANRVAVVGHSRGGKAALWAGAEDERFAMVVSNDSGEGGAALSRRNFGETIARINTSFPHWFDDNYKAFNGRPEAAPLDQHMLLALVAPRLLYIASADQDLWADQRGEFLSLAHTSPVYALWGDAPIAPDAMPALASPLLVGRRAYHIRTGGHDLTPYDWMRFADAADRHWAGPARVEMTWMSIANMFIQASDLGIVADGYISRIPQRTFHGGGGGLAFTRQRHVPDENAVRRVLDAIGGPSAVTLLLTGHSHFDHSFDTSTWSKLTGARALGPRTTCLQMAASRLGDRCTTVNGRETISLADGVTVRVVRWNHSGDPAVNGEQHDPVELEAEPQLDPATPGFRTGVAEDFPNGGGGRAFLFTVDGPSGQFSWFMQDSASAVDLHVPVVVNGVDYGAPLQNLEVAMRDARLDSVDLWISTGGAAVAKLVLPILKPKAYLPVHWDGLWAPFEAGLPLPFSDAPLEALLAGANVTLVKPTQYMDKWRLDTTGLHPVPNTPVKRALGFTDVQTFPRR